MRAWSPWRWIGHIAASAPEIFLFLAVAIGTLLGRVRLHGFALGPTACTLIVAVVLGLFGHHRYPGAAQVDLLRTLFVFTIGYRAGPQFFASLSFRRSPRLCSLWS